MTLNNQQRAVQAREFGKSVDFGRTSDDYAKHRPGPPTSLYDRLAAFMPNGSFHGTTAVDVGSGTGFVGIEIAKRGARVVAVDTSANQLAEAQHLAEQAGVSIETCEAKAEDTGLEAGSFDLWIASQAWHWFDPVRAGKEAIRLLKPGGLAVCCNFDYLPGRSDIARRTEELILKFTPSWPMAGGTGCHVRPLFELPAAGLDLVEQASWEHAQAFTHEGWRGRMRTCNGVGGHHPPEVVEKFDAELRDLLRLEFPREPMVVTHRVWMVVARKP